MKSSCAPSFPYVQLTDLTLSGSPVCSRTILWFLERCRSLQRFRWDPNPSQGQKEDGDMDHFEPDALVLHQLTHLDISPFVPSLYNFFVLTLPYIRTPNLRSLVFQPRMDPFLIYTLNDLISRSGCQIQNFQAPFPSTFSLDGSYELDTEQEYLELLASFANVESFCIDGTGRVRIPDPTYHPWTVDELYLQAMAPEGNEVLLPKLESLGIVIARAGRGATSS
ncbi:hypothetical protein BDV98DRAFT_223020 [Pterulicium gracile]|uniref:Uncharacterized protein n=1 Tax=Pterulicium gracile TaxID=1884261 RepID=A0A5C3QYX2_9AGAR|nr:hypothetical protein BDV98DRAFT_223020 [Pterula gracilis]